jgi:alanine-glyoxylate transaminase/serine-glyoxylate transaminase/serine-pyruvate transaminase
MTLSHGPQTLAIPGPSIVPERVLRAMHRASPNIYTGALVEMTRSLVPDLKRVARTGQQVAMYIGNGHTAWEASLANTHSRGDRVLVPLTGAFGRGWAEMAEGLGLQVETLDFGTASPIDAARIGERLRADPAHEIRSVLVVHVDTSTSLRSDLAAIRREIDAAGHPALLQVDAIASLGCDRIEMDGWDLDVLLAGSQKGLMLPPGMAFVFFGERADRARGRADCVTRHLDWRPRAEPPTPSQRFNGTAPTHHLHGLRESLDMIVHEEGIEAVWARHETLARAVWAAFETWERPGGVRLNVRERAHRSHAVTALELPGQGTRLRDWTERTAGLTLGIGIGMAPPDDPRWHDFFRVGHMGHLSAHSLMGTLGCIGAGLKAIGVPHGDGGLDAAATVVAGA